jgi:hypothetical protein
MATKCDGLRLRFELVAGTSAGVCHISTASCVYVMIEVWTISDRWLPWGRKGVQGERQRVS